MYLAFATAQPKNSWMAIGFDRTAAALLDDAKDENNNEGYKNAIPDSMKRDYLLTKATNNDNQGNYEFMDFRDYQGTEDRRPTDNRGGDDDALTEFKTTWTSEDGNRAWKYEAQIRDKTVNE